LSPKKSFRAPDVSSALAAEMVSLYRSKVLPKNSSDVPVLSSSCPPSATIASPARGRVENSRNTLRMLGVEARISIVMPPPTTFGTNVPLVSKSPFKLVKAKTIRSAACAETILPHVLKPLLTTAHSDKIGNNVAVKMTQGSTSSSFHSDSGPCSTGVNTTGAVSHSSDMPKNLSKHIRLAVPTNSNTVNKPRNNCAAVSSFANFVYEKSASPKVSFISSKYKLIRRRGSGCRDASRQTCTTPLKDASITALVPHRAVKHTPTLLAVNKYKLVRKKRSSLTPSATRTPLDVKKITSPVKLSTDVLLPARRNSSVTSSKTRSSRYKLVRKNDHAHSTVVKKSAAQSTWNRVDDKVQVLSKYKLVRRKSTATLRTPQHATPALADYCQHITPSRSLNNKYITPPLFLNKYKLIRKRALLRTSSKHSTLLRSHCLMRTRKPSAEGYKHLYSRKRPALAEMSSLYKKRGTRKRSFLSKYALQRSGKGREHYLLVNITFLYCNTSCILVQLPDAGPVFIILVIAC